MAAHAAFRGRRWDSDRTSVNSVGFRGKDTEEKVRSATILLLKDTIYAVILSEKIRKEVGV